MTSTVEASSYHFVQSLERGLAVINAFDAEHPTLTLGEVSRLTGINRAAARRFLLTLADLGYVSVQDRSFSLTPKVLNLGYAYLSALSLPEIALPHLRNLATAVGESSYLSVLAGDETVCVASVPIRRIWSTSLSVGTRLPALTTAAGRVLLAEQSDERVERLLAGRHVPRFTPHTITDPEGLKAELKVVREQGWALIDQELEDGIRTIAVPIRTDGGPASFTVSISTLAGSSSPDVTRGELLPQLREAKGGIEADAHVERRGRPASSSPGSPG